MKTVVTKQVLALCSPEEVATLKRQRDRLLHVLRETDLWVKHWGSLIPRESVAMTRQQIRAAIADCERE